MFKVSFKETPKSPSKIVEKVGKTTTVILRGTVKLPTFYPIIPLEIMEWVGSRSDVEIYEYLSEDVLIIYSTGVAKCNDGDKYDSIFGERLAETRAKYHIYKFFYDFTHKLIEYYSKILYGEHTINEDESKEDCLMECFNKYSRLMQQEVRHEKELLASLNYGTDK